MISFVRSCKNSMSRFHVAILVCGLLALAALALPAAAQEEPPTEAPADQELVDVPEPAVEVVSETPAEEEPAWTFRYLVPTSLVVALLVVVGSIVAYFVKVVRTRYRLIQ